MSRLLAYLRSLLVSQVYVVLDGGTCVGVRGRLQGAELLRAKHARAWADEASQVLLCGLMPPNRDGDFWAIEYRDAYDRQRVSCHELRDV